MAHYLGDTIESIVVLIDAAGNRVSGAVVAGAISVNLYNPLDILDGPLVVTEIAATGAYRCEFTRLNPGAWKVLWTCTSPVCSKVRTFDLVIDPSIAILVAIANVPAAADVALSATHGAGSWETADICEYSTQAF